MSSSRNIRKFEMAFLVMLLNKSKVLIPCKNSIKTSEHGSYFIYFHIPKFWDVTFNHLDFLRYCDRIDMAKE
jgi:hypothetical protein